MQIEPEDALKIIIVVGLFCAAIGFLLGAWAGIGSEKARIKNMEKMSMRIVDYYNKMKLAIPIATTIIDSDKKVPRFPPGPPG